MPVCFRSRPSLLTASRASHTRNRRALLVYHQAYANHSKEKYPYAINSHRGIFCFEKCTKQCPYSATKSLQKYSYSATINRIIYRLHTELCLWHRVHSVSSQDSLILHRRYSITTPSIITIKFGIKINTINPIPSLPNLLSVLLSVPEVSLLIEDNISDQCHLDALSPF